MDERQRHDEGMKVRRAVLGDAHVDRAEANKTPFDEDFQRYITENAWGSVWARPGMDNRTRCQISIKVLETGRPSSSRTRPETIIRSPSGSPSVTPFLLRSSSSGPTDSGP